MLLNNPAISEQFEPGSIFKIVAMAAALDAGTITPDFTYNDQGSITVGGVRRSRTGIARRTAYVDATQVLVDSLNVGMATISRQMGPTNFLHHDEQVRRRQADRHRPGRRAGGHAVRAR